MFTVQAFARSRTNGSGHSGAGCCRLATGGILCLFVVKAAITASTPPEPYTKCPVIGLTAVTFNFLKVEG